MVPGKAAFIVLCVFLSSQQVTQFSEGPWIHILGGLLIRNTCCKIQGPVHVNLWRDCFLTQDIVFKIFYLEGGGRGEDVLLMKEKRH